MRSLILLLFFGIPSLLAAQVGIGTSSPASSSALDVSSDTRGFLPPRMTLLQIKNIVAPVAGLMVFNLDQNRPCYFSGTKWLYFDSTIVLPELGKFFQPAGGIVILIDGTGSHGLAAATLDQSTFAPYGCYNTAIPGAQFTAVGTGNSNTTAILSFCSTAGIAAKLCRDLVLNGFNDWYLPSRDELALVYTYRVVLGMTGGGYYWSSTNISATQSSLIDFATGSTIALPQSSGRYVRAIRSF